VRIELFRHSTLNVKSAKNRFAGNVTSHAGARFAGRCFVETVVAKENTAVVTIAAGSVLIARHFHVVVVAMLVLWVQLSNSPTQNAL
jgi:hypothetical protein